MLPLDGPKAACADNLPLVDKAFDRPGGPAAQMLKKWYCPTCPLADACLVEGMRGEAGVWAGTSPNLRTRHGAPKASKRVQRRARTK